MSRRLGALWWSLDTLGQAFLPPLHGAAGALLFRTDLGTRQQCAALLSFVTAASVILTAAYFAYTEPDQPPPAQPRQQQVAGGWQLGEAWPPPPPPGRRDGPLSASWRWLAGWLRAALVVEGTAAQRACNLLLFLQLAWAVAKATT